MTIKTSGAVFSFGIYSEQLINPFFSILPGAQANYSITKAKAEDELGNFAEAKESSMSYRFDVAFLFKASKTFFMFAAPAISLFEGETTESINIGFGLTSEPKSHIAKNEKIVSGLSQDDLQLDFDKITKLPNFRAAVPQASKYTDQEIVKMFRKKFPKFNNKTDDELIALIEKNYARKASNK